MHREENFCGGYLIIWGSLHASFVWPPHTHRRGSEEREESTSKANRILIAAALFCCWILSVKDDTDVCARRHPLNYCSCLFLHDAPPCALQITPYSFQNRHFITQTNYSLRSGVVYWIFEFSSCVSGNQGVQNGIFGGRQKLRKYKWPSPHCYKTVEPAEEDTTAFLERGPHF